MKKLLTIIAAVIILALAGCIALYFIKPQGYNGVQEATTKAKNLFTKKETMPEEKIVKETPKNTEEHVEAGDDVVVDYIGRLEDESVFDTSLEAVAKEAGIYSAGRDYTSGLPFTVGAGMMIAGFDEGVLGMKEGETKTVTISAAKAYGDAIVEVPMPKAEIEMFLPEGELLEIGKKTLNVEGQEVEIEVIAIEGDLLTLKMNNPHPLGGKTLIFDITIKSITKA